MKHLKYPVILALFAFSTCLSSAAETTKTSALIVFDASGSMWGQIEGKAKIEIAREVVADLVRGLPDDSELGLMAYGHRRKGDCADIELLIPVGKVNKSDFISTVEDIMPKGMTPITDSLKLAAEGMRYTEQKATVILVSDGLETCDADPCEAARKLKELGVDFTAHVIAFDLKPEETEKLECIAKSTGGQFFPASDADSLKDALDFAIEEAAPTAKVEEPEMAPEPDRTATISAPDTAVAGSKITVTWENETMKGDYITIAKAGSEDREKSGYSYTFEKDSVEVTGLIEPGDAEIRYIAAKTGKVLARHPITLTEFEVTLEAPEEVVAGGSLPVSWTGPDYPGDFITVVMKDTEEEKWAKYQYTKSGTPLEIETPITTGAAEIRYIAGQNRKTLARLPVTLTVPEVTLKAPEEAVAGATVPVEWTGPANEGDFVTVVMKDTEEEKWAKYQYAKEEGTLKILSPITPGEAEIRYITGQGRKTLARIPLTLTKPGATLKSPEEAVAGATVSVEWTGPANEGDFITIVMKDTEEEKWAKYQYAKEEGILKIESPTTPGEAEIRYINGQGREALARIPITLTEAKVTLKAPEQAVAGAMIPVEWTGPANQGDFITVVIEGTEEEKWAKYQYAKEAGTLKIESPITPGAAEIRYLTGQDRKTLARIPLTLTKPVVTLEAPAKAPAGSKVTVKWTGPGNKSDFITIVPKATEEEKWEKYAYAKEEGSVSIQAPDKTGDAEIRYLAGQGRKTLHRIPITITPAEE